MNALCILVLPMLLLFWVGLSRSSSCKRRAERLLTIGLWTLALPGCLGGCMTLALFNPGAIMFIDPVVLQNDASDEVFVTPLTEGDLEFRTLPTVVSSWCALPSPKASTYRIPAGGTVALYYDGDNAWMSAIVVEGPTGDSRMFEPQHKAPEEWAGPDRYTYRIPPWADLPPAPTELVDAVRSDRALTRFLTFVLPMIATIAWFVFLMMRYRFKRRLATDSQPPPDEESGHGSVPQP